MHYVKSCHRLFSWTLCLALGSLGQGVSADSGSAETQYLDQTRHWVEQAMAQKPAEPANRLPGWSALKTEVSIGILDSRLRLARCEQIQPYMPVGMSLWGKSQIGLRCLDRGVKWNVFLPVTVKAFGPAWVLKNNIGTGQVLTEADVVQAEVDWAQERGAVLSEPSQWSGQLSAYPLAAGQALRQGMIKPAQVFAAGAQIRIIAVGQGFEVSSVGLALSAGVVGQSARVKSDGGRILSGLVIDGRTVKLDL